MLSIFSPPQNVLTRIALEDLDLTIFPDSLLRSTPDLERCV